MKGFSLIELVIVITMIAILAVFAMPLWPGYSINIAAQADQLAADILYTQTLAITTGQRYSLVRVTSTTYQIQNSTGTAILYPGSAKTTITLNSGVTFGTFINLPSNLIAFDGKGTPYSTAGSPGTLLVATAQIPLTATSVTKTIIISPTTGWIKIQ